jgi:hypothetical protein
MSRVDPEGKDALAYRVMRKLYLLVALAALIPVTYAAGCGGNNDTSTGGGSNASTQGGQVQNFAYDVKVNWTVLGQKPSATSCTDNMVMVVLSGTEDPSLHNEKTVDCTKGPIDFPNLTRLGAGSTILVEGYLQNAMGMTVLSTMQQVTPMTGGTVEVNLDFEMPTSSATTAVTNGPGPSSTSGGMGGMGGAGGAGGNGGAGQSTSSSTSSSHAASSSSSTSSSHAASSSSSG